MLSEHSLSRHVFIEHVKAPSGGIEQETKMKGILPSHSVGSQASKESPVSAFLGLWEITSIYSWKDMTDLVLS